MDRRTKLRIHKGWLFCLLCAGIGIALCLMLCSPSFDTNDDENIIAIASGAFTGAPYAANGYTTFLYGALLQGLYLLSPALPWHTLVMYLLIWISLAAILKALLMVCDQYNLSAFVGLGFFAALLIGILVQYVATLQYTTTAAFAATGGTGLLIAANGAEKRAGAKGAYWIGGGLLLFAFCLRTESFWVAMPLLAGVTVLISVKRKKWRVLLPVLLVMGGAVLTGIFDQALYRANEPHWDAFRTYYQMRVQLLDYYNTDLMEKVATQTLGWPVDTVRLMRNWYMLDEHMQLEPLTELITAVKAAQPVPSIWDLAKSVASILRRYSMFSLNALGLGVAALWALIRFGKQRRWAEGVAVLGTITYMLVFIAYFYGIVNRLPQRAAFSIACPTAVVLLLVCLPSLENNLKDASPRLRLRAMGKPAIWVMTLCLCMAMLTNAFWAKNRLPLRWEQNGQAVRAAISEHIRDYASARPESVFVTDVAQRYTPFTTEPFTAVNLLEWGHAMRGSDVLAKKYAANGLNGFTTDTLFDSRVRLILSDGNRALFVNYIQQRNASAHLVTVDDGDGFTVYQLKAGEQ